MTEETKKVDLNPATNPALRDSLEKGREERAELMRKLHPIKRVPRGNAVKIA